MDDEIESVTVRRKVFEAARHVEALAGDPAFHFAEIMRDAYRRAGENGKADFWHEVWTYLMTLESVGEKATITILPDDGR